MGKKIKTAINNNDILCSLPFLKAITKSVDLRTIIIDEKNTILFNNNYLAHNVISNHKRVSLIGNNFIDYLKENYKNNFEQFIKKSFQGKFLRKEVKLGTNSDTSYFLISFSPVKKGTKVKYVCISIKNLSELKKLQNSLKENKDHLEETRQLGKLASFKFEYPYGKVIWSKETKDILGLDLSRNPMNIYELLSFVHPDDKDKLITTIEKSISSPGHFKVVFRFLQEENIKHIQMNFKIEKNEKNKLYITGNLIDVTETIKAEEKIQNILMENNLLLKEMQHRVKNNFQVMLSLLNLQAKQIKDPEYSNIFKVTQNRIKTLSLIYDKLYQSKEDSKVEFGELVNQIVKHLIYVYNVNPLAISIKLEIDSIFIDLKKAVPCALIINELVSNSLQHAFPDNKTGEITITLKEKNDNIDLIIEDSGIGIPSNINYKSADTLGLQLVMTLVNQIDGLVNYDGSKGSKFIINFKL